jgi:phosphomethylpyrimidine synthase
VGERLEKLHTTVHHGADTVTDLSTSKDIENTCRKIIDNIPVPVGTVSFYPLLEDLGGNIEDMNSEQFRDIVEHRAKQGIEYMTTHCIAKLEHLDLSDNRVTRIVIRGRWLIPIWNGSPVFCNFAQES